MSSRFLYNPGDIQHNYKMISRDYKNKNGKWYCTFECLECHKIFQGRLTKVFHDGIGNCDCHSKVSNLKGQTKGVYTILDRAPSRPNNRNAYWYCQCQCGIIFEISSTDFNRHEHKICPHKQDEGLVKIGMGRPVSVILEGKTFGKLAVGRYLGNRYWECFCECGNIVNKRADSLLEQRGLACPTCLAKMSSGEALLSKIFEEIGYDFEYQKKFDTCIFPNTQRSARFDFYLPALNLLFEYNGEQHYTQNHFSKGDAFEASQFRDNYKKEWCIQNRQPLIIIPYNYSLSTEKVKQLIQKQQATQQLILEITP